MEKCESAKWLPALVVGWSIGIVSCGTSTPGASDLGATGGGASGGASTGGSASGGTTTGGAGPGGSASGGTASGGQAAGGAGTGGSPSGGTSSTGGSDAAGGNGSGGGGPGAVTPSPGCTASDGVQTLTSGGASVSGGLSTSTRLSIEVGGSNRDYIIDIPADYEPTHPYRLIFSWHQAYGSANGNAVGQYPANDGPHFDAENYAYFGLHREAMAAGEPALFVAPQGIGDFPWDYERDVVLFDELLALVSANLCIDESRVFTTGFSFGAMMSHALSLGRASKLRGAVTMAPANYNFIQPPKEGASVAYFGITGMGDGVCKWINSDQAKEGGKYCVLSHAEDNGCMESENFQTAAVGSQQHLCYDFEGCDAGYPVKVCTFDGGHTPSSVSDGMAGDDGLHAFVPPLAWDFISGL